MTYNVELKLNKDSTRFFRYSGNKLKYINLLNSVINKNVNNRVYIEPFVGSGALLFNLEQEFDEYIINDIDRNIIRIYKTFKEIEYKDYLEELNFVSTEFGDIKNDKEAYYNFRNWYNKNYWNTDELKEGIYLHFLANTCINSFLRFGPNGMNQSYGNRLYTLDQETFNKIKSVLLKTTIYNKDYKDIIDENPKGFYFFDPPYFSQKSSYTSFDESEFLEFLTKLDTLDYVYTDIQNEYNSYLDGQLIREMVSTAPHSTKAKNGNMEYLFMNLKEPKSS